MQRSTALLAAGYVLAVPFSVYIPGFLRLWRRREPAVVGAQQVGAVLVTLGWADRGNAPATVTNALWVVGLPVALVLEGRKRARPSAP